MHGRLKVRTTEEQKLIKQKEQQKKLATYKYVLNQVHKNRKSVPYDKESFMLCAQVLVVNPDVYTLWNYRKEVVLQQIEQSKEKEKEEEGKQKNILNKENEENKGNQKEVLSKEKEEKGGEGKQKELIAFLENEIKLTEHCLLDNPKSYSSWHHRYWVLQHHPEPNWQQEFNLITKYLTLDDRNFHCWDYRRLLINKIGISLQDELNFSMEMLNVNFSNYSSWHYRSTLRKVDSECLDKEINLVQSAVFTDPGDSSAWFYFRWVLSNPDVSMEKREVLLEALNQLLEMDPDCKWILMAKCWLTDSLHLNDKKFVDTRVLYYQRLKELDPLRKGQYEDYMKSTAGGAGDKEE